MTRLIHVTPPGAARPWRTARSLGFIEKMLAEGISEGDLVAFVEDAAELVRSGREEPRWWSVGNLFGDRTLDMWRAKIEEMHAAANKRKAIASELQRREDEHRAESSAAPPAQVRDLSLQRLINTARDAWSPRWQQENEDDAKQA